MDVVTAEQAKIAEDAGAVAVMALERVPADIRAQGGVARMSDPDIIDAIIVDRLDPGHGQGPHRPLRRGAGAAVPRRRLRRRVRGAHPGRLRPPHRQVGLHGALRLRGDQPRRGAAPDHRGRGDDPLQGRGRHRRRLERHDPHAHAAATRSAGCTSLPEDELYLAAKELQAPYDLVKEVATAGKLPVVLFTAGGIATPADAAMMMQLGAEGVFVGSGIFKSGNPAERAAAIVKATTFYDDPDVIAKVSRGLGEAMVGINVDDVPRPAPAGRARLVTCRSHGRRGRHGPVHRLGPEWAVRPDGVRFRDAARVILLDARDRVLLLHGCDADQRERTWWFTVGGGIDAGESALDAAVREVLEETGLLDRRGGPRRPGVHAAARSSTSSARPAGRTSSSSSAGGPATPRSLSSAATAGPTSSTTRSTSCAGGTSTSSPRSTRRSSRTGCRTSCAACWAAGTA